MSAPKGAAPVDVLAVLAFDGGHAHRYRAALVAGDGRPAYTPEQIGAFNRHSDEALAAVVDLAKTAQLMADLMPDAELETDAVQGRIVADLRAALAPFQAGGAK